MSSGPVLVPPLAAGGAAPVITVTTLPNGRYGTTVSAQVANTPDTDHTNNTGSFAA